MTELRFKGVFSKPKLTIFVIAICLVCIVLVFNLFWKLETPDLNQSVQLKPQASSFNNQGAMRGEVQIIGTGGAVDYDSFKHIVEERKRQGSSGNSNQNKTSINETGPRDENILVEKLYITGTIKPIKMTPVIAPFDGAIHDIFVSLGSYVNTNEAMIQLDTSKIDERLRETQSALIKAQIQVDKYSSWSDGSEMQRAKRSVNDAERELQRAKRYEIETQGLYEKGIIPRNEYDNAIEQNKSRQSAYDAALIDYKTTLEQGGERALKMADLELENAQSRLKTVETDKENYIVKSSVSGIVTMPPDNGNVEQKHKTIEPGVQVMKGDSLFTIADISKYIAEGEVDEIDINKLKIDQEVIIESDALPGLHFNGKITEISSEANISVGMAKIPKYRIKALFQYAEDQKNLIKIGMSARLTIIVTPPHKAVVVPLEYIIDNDKNPKLKVIRNGKEITVPVVIGASTINGVTIESGVFPNDEIVEIDN